MTQKTSILSFLLKNPNSRPFQIAKALGFPAPSVRRELFELRQDNRVSKPRKNFTVSILRKTIDEIKFQKPEEIEVFYVKVLKTGNSGLWSRNLVASTYEDKENPDRFKELKKAMEEYAQLDQIPIGDLGYSNNFQDTEPIDTPEFPEIEVHTEWIIEI